MRMLGADDTNLFLNELMRHPQLRAARFIHMETPQYKAASKASAVVGHSVTLEARDYRFDIPHASIMDLPPLAALVSVKLAEALRVGPDQFLSDPTDILGMQRAIVIEEHCVRLRAVWARDNADGAKVVASVNLAATGTAAPRSVL